MGDKLEVLSKVILEVEQELYCIDKEEFEDYYFEIENKLQTLVEIYEIINDFINGEIRYV